MLFNQPLKGLSDRERREYLWLMRLRTVPQFRELLNRLDRGQSVWATTTWFMEQANRGDLSDCSFETARRYLSYLATRIKKEREKHPKADMTRWQEAAVKARMETNIKAAVQGLPVPDDPSGIADISKVLTKELEDLDAISILKYSFAIQKQRVIELRTLEKAAKVPMPFGNEAVELLKKIGAEIWKVEAGEALLRLKNAWSPKAMGQAPRETATLSSEAQEVAKLGDVDKNLVREAYTRTMQLLEEECSSGHTYRVEADKGGAETPKGTGN